jgi:hypothetical protein
MATKKVLCQSGGEGYLAVVGYRVGRSVEIDLAPILALVTVQVGNKPQLQAWVLSADGEAILSDELPGFLGIIEPPNDDDDAQEIIEQWASATRASSLPKREADEDEDDEEDPDSDEEDPEDEDESEEEDPDEDRPVRVRPSRR